VFHASGRIVAMAQREFRQIFPQPGWVEHDANEIWATQQAVALEALFKAKLNASDIAAIGITNQRETTVLWNRRTGQPMANAIVARSLFRNLCVPLRASGNQLRARSGSSYLPAQDSLAARPRDRRARAIAGRLVRNIDSWLL
jgi:glycerol kinase